MAAGYHPLPGPMRSRSRSEFGIKHGVLPWAFVRLSTFVYEVVSGRSGHSGRLNDDGRSELELVTDAAMPDGIQIRGDFRVE